jgi:hypothetical protein
MISCDCFINIPAITIRHVTFETTVSAPAKMEPLAVAYWATMFNPLKANPKPAPLAVAITVFFVTTSTKTLECRRYHYG